MTKFGVENQMKELLNDQPTGRLGTPEGTFLLLIARAGRRR